MGTAPPILQEPERTRQLVDIRQTGIKPDEKHKSIHSHVLHFLNSYNHHNSRWFDLSSFLRFSPGFISPGGEKC